jgi:predicted enzyme related to lactoylglutathione lyase
MTEGHGKFVWYDLMTTDLNAAEAFYCDVIGWTAADSGMTHQKYVLFSQGGQMVAGLMETPPEAAAMGAPPSWTGHIAVDDVDEYAAKVKAAGGTIRRPPEDIPGIGRFSVVADPHGATFVLFKGNTEAPPEVPPGTPGHVGWNELQSGDLATAWPFYESLFGWTKVDDMDMGPMGVYRTFAAAGKTSAIGGMMTKTPQTPAPMWSYYFNVPSVKAAMECAKGSGGQILMGPQQVPGGQWVARIADPQGGLVAIVSNEP